VNTVVKLGVLTLVYIPNTWMSIQIVSVNLILKYLHWATI